MVYFCLQVPIIVFLSKKNLNVMKKQGIRCSFSLPNPGFVEFILHDKKFFQEKKSIFILHRLHINVRRRIFPTGCRLQATQYRNPADSLRGHCRCHCYCHLPLLLLLLLPLLLPLSNRHKKNAALVCAASDFPYIIS